MKKSCQRAVSILLTVLLLFSVLPLSSVAAEYGPYDYESYVIPDLPIVPLKSTTMSPLMKTLYNLLNRLADSLLKIVCAVYPNPSDWKDISEYDKADYTPGRETYALQAAEENVWRVGYGSRSIVPTDFAPGTYYIGRDMTNRLAQGVNDDNRVRAVALDDNSGEGIVVFAAVDALGVTSADTIAVREAVTAWAESRGIRIAALNLSATHSHSALDTQGVATESIYKILTSSFKNLFDLNADPRLKNAERFKTWYVQQAIKTVEDAISDMREGDLYYASVDVSDLIRDKRGLIEDKDLPPVAMLKFVPADGSAGVYISDIACHPTTFSASYGLLSSDYIYYMEQRLAEKTGYRFLFMQGTSGQISSSNVRIDESKLPAEEQRGATTRYLGKTMADHLLAADDGTMEKLEPVLNAKYTSFTFAPTNYILLLAVKARLVNNQVFLTGTSPNDAVIVMEEGYVELGGRVGFGIFPVELYPEVFYGSEILGGVSWDGTERTYGAPVDMAPRDGIDMYALPLTNDSLGYCVPDDNFAFFGHIIGDNIADEVLSLGKHTASTVVTEFEKLMEQCG